MIVYQTAVLHCVLPSWLAAFRYNDRQNIQCLERAVKQFTAVLPKWTCMINFSLYWQFADWCLPHKHADIQQSSTEDETVYISAQWTVGHPSEMFSCLLISAYLLSFVADLFIMCSCICTYSCLVLHSSHLFLVSAFVTLIMIAYLLTYSWTLTFCNVLTAMSTVCSHSGLITEVCRFEICIILCNWPHLVCHTAMTTGRLGVRCECRKVLVYNAFTAGTWQLSLHRQAAGRSRRSSRAVYHNGHVAQERQRTQLELYGEW